MKEINGVKYYRVSEVCKMVGRSHTTITRVWYGAEEYAKEHNIHFPFVLPTYRTDLDKKGSRYWSEEGVQKLIQFRDRILPGDLAFYNREYMWGERNKILKDKQDFKKELSEEIGEDVNELLRKEPNNNDSN